MKLFFKLVKKVCIGLFSIYSVNLLFSALNVLIPINFITIFVSSLLGIYGVFALMIIQFIL